MRHGATLTLTETLGDGTLVLRSDRRSADAELRRLLALEVAGSLLVLALAAIALTLLVRRAVAPLDRMTRVAASIASGHGGQRLRPERTDTELGRMAGAFDAMLDSLEASNSRARESEERMREFLGDISHELRTPVTGLVASAERLLREGAVEDPEHERLLVAMVRQSGRAGRLIDDLLTLGRLQAGDALAVGEVDLAHVAREEAARTRLLAPGVTVGVAGTPRLPVRGDGDRIAQVLANLLDNARHAVGVAGAIQVTLAAEAGLARVEVRDDGPGVPEADRERIFERLVRLDPSRSRVSFGSGLGLSIAREIARAHGGELVCAEHPGGARFVLTLPSAGPVGAGEPPTPSGVSLKLG